MLLFPFFEGEDLSEHTPPEYWNHSENRLDNSEHGVLAHEKEERRRLLHFNVTPSPSACWVIQQLREAFPGDLAPRFLLYDRDCVFSAEVTATIRNLGSEPVRTAYRSPWQNPFAEQWIGTCRRELLDHVIVLVEQHLRPQSSPRPRPGPGDCGIPAQRGGDGICPAGLDPGRCGE